MKRGEKFLQKKKVVSINGSVILAKGEGDFAMHDIVHIGSLKLLGEVIKIEKDIATIQVYENTTGLKMGEEVIGEEEPLSLVLGPGIMGNIFDGIERPLQVLKQMSGDFIERGMDLCRCRFRKNMAFCAHHENRRNGSLKFYPWGSTRNRINYK